MRARLPLAALVSLACSCHPAPESFDAAYTLTLAGSTAPFAGPVTIAATPSPADGTALVRFTIDDAPGPIDIEAPYSMTTSAC